MAKRKGKHVSDSEQYNAYSAGLKRIKNRKARLARHLKKHPNDAQAVDATKVEGKQRDKSGTKGNYPEQKFYLFDKAGNKILIGSFEPAFRGKK